MAMDSIPSISSSTFACKCLNIIISTRSTQTTPPHTSDPFFSPVFVGEEGISVKLPELTLRIHSKAQPTEIPSRLSRYTSSTCLTCDTLVYRVHHFIPIDLEGKEGPLLPTEDWVEAEIMKSSTGWIEVHQGCLTGEAILKVQSSPNYSPTFSLVLPVPSRPTSPQPNSESPSSRSESSTPTITPTTYLSHLRPIFPPPPFTPSHPVFLHLASIAETHSQTLRAAAEQRIADIVRDQISSLERAEADLGREVETLWRTFKAGINKFEQERHHTVSPRSPIARPGERGDRVQTNGVGSPPYGTPIAIRNFVPSVVSPTRTSPPRTLNPRVSALSTSLATSQFHHPREQRSQRSITPSRDSVHSASSRTLSSSSASPTLTQSAPDEGSNVLQFKRNTNDAVNTAVSFRYLQNLEEDMALYKRAQQKQKEEKQALALADQSQQPGTSEAVPTPEMVGDKDAPPNTASTSLDRVASNTHEGRSPSRGREKTVKGKRKVTFDIQPTVATADSEQDVASSQSNNNTAPAQEMIFDIEDEGNERAVDPQPSLPLLEQPLHPRTSRPKHARSQSAGLSESFPTLRPVTLPTPSHIRPPRGMNGVDSSQAVLSPPQVVSVTSHEVRSNGLKEQVPDTAEVDDPRRAEILKLVAADVPSHRGAWTPDSKAWKTFTKRQDGKGATHGIDEETEDDRLAQREVNTTGDKNEFSSVVGSLPIPVNPLNRPREVLTLASYQTKVPHGAPVTSEPPPAQKVISSNALRKAIYAERDRSRLIDPGTLDFAVDNDDDDDDDIDDDEEETADNSGKPSTLGDRGRKRALKILQVRSELPGEGMWRSLAT